MAELKEGQQIIFKRKGQDSDSIRVGIHYDGYVQYHVSGFSTVIPVKDITEWCDASEAWKSHEFVNSKPFRNPVYGPTVEPIK